MPGRRGARGGKERTEKTRTYLVTLIYGLSKVNEERAAGVGRGGRGGGSCVEGSRGIHVWASTKYIVLPVYPQSSV